MNNQNILSDADLNAVSGGLTCENAVHMANAYMAMSSVFYAYGDTATGAAYGDKAVKTLHNVCGTGGK